MGGRTVGVGKEKKSLMIMAFQEIKTILDAQYQGSLSSQKLLLHEFYAR